MVFASLPDSSFNLFAALPVGAQMPVFSPRKERQEHITSTTVLFPVPGPPVSMKSPFFKDIKTASFCFSSSTIPRDFWAISTAFA